MEAPVGVGDSDFSVITSIVLIYSSHSWPQNKSFIYLTTHNDLYCTMKSGSESEQICVYLTVV